MEGILVCLGRNRNGPFERKAQTAADGKLAKRYLIIVNLDEGRSVRDTTRALGVAESTVRRVRQRFVAYGDEYCHAGIAKWRNPTDS